MTSSLDRAIQRSATSHGARYVDLLAAFTAPDGHGDMRRLLADDLDHPNAAGVRVMADALAAANATR